MGAWVPGGSTRQAERDDRPNSHAMPWAVHECDAWRMISKKVVVGMEAQPRHARKWPHSTPPHT
eukprot:scaffold47629_cov18-Tisochrysis_lutea.AAC.1